MRESDDRPRRGDRYAVPFTGGEEVALPAGLEFVVADDPAPEATGVSAEPDPYGDWELRLVEERHRTHEKYAGYGLVISFDTLSRYYKRL